MFPRTRRTIGRLPATRGQHGSDPPAVGVVLSDPRRALTPRERSKDSALPTAQRRERPRGRLRTRNARGAGQTRETCIRHKAGASDDRDDGSPADDAAGLAAGEYGVCCVACPRPAFAFAQAFAGDSVRVAPLAWQPRHALARWWPSSQTAALPAEPRRRSRRRLAPFRAQRGKSPRRCASFQCRCHSAPAAADRRSP